MEKPISDAQVMVDWNRRKLERFRAAISAEVLRGTDRNDVFTFDGNQYVLAYAAYLAEYLDSKLETP